MPRLKSVSDSDLDTETLALLEPVRSGAHLPAVYRQFANSQPALRAYLGMEASLREGSLDARTLEGIKLLVSEETGCEYCLSVHTVKSRQAGIDADTAMAIRRGEPLEDPRLDCVLRLVRALLRERGELRADLLSEARAVGLEDGHLVDIAMAVSTIYFTNITNHINATDLTLPPAPAITSDGTDLR